MRRITTKNANRVSDSVLNGLSLAVLPCAKFQVVELVVVPDAVAMVNGFSWQQVSAERDRHHDAVLKQGLARMPDIPITRTWIYPTAAISSRELREFSTFTLLGVMPTAKTETFVSATAGGELASRLSAVLAVHHWRKGAAQRPLAIMGRTQTTRLNPNAAITKRTNCAEEAVVGLEPTFCWLMRPVRKKSTSGYQLPATPQWSNLRTRCETQALSNKGVHALRVAVGVAIAGAQAGEVLV